MIDEGIENNSGGIAHALAERSISFGHHLGMEPVGTQHGPLLIEM